MKLVRNLQTGHPGAHAGPRALSVRGFLRLAEDHGRSAEGGSTPGSAGFPLPAPGLCPPLPAPGPRAGPGKTRGPLRGREPGARDLSWAPKPLRQGLGVLPVPCGPRVCGFTGHLAGPTAAPGRPPRGNATGERRLWAARRAPPACPRRTPGGPVTGSSDGKEVTSFPASPPSRVGHRLCGRSGGYTWGREGRKSRPRLLLHQSNEVIFP